MKHDERSFDVISELAALRRYAGTLARNPGDAEDLVHDALVKAYARRETFRPATGRPGAGLRNWLFSILHNTHVDRLRAAATRHRGDERERLEADSSYPAAQEHSARLRQVRNAFMTLPEGEREALHLVAVEELTYQEAAEALGIPIGTLMSRVSRARARLREFEEGKHNPVHLRLVGGSDD